MIYVCQGHEHGVGLEIFLKSFIMLSSDDQKKFFLAVDEKTLKDHLTFLGLDKKSFQYLNIHFLKKNDFAQSTKSLSVCLSKIQPDDILITLPTSKDQLIFNGKNQAGYTEFFRTYFQLNSISMIFKSFNENVLLISDHVSLKDVSKYITNELIESKVEIALNGFSKYFNPIEEVILAGINPHAGENGILGNEEIILQNSLNNLRSKFKQTFSNFLSGDTLHFYKNSKLNQLFVYMFHDQALSKFKAQNGLIGLNITFGLPFLRLSVDHGTASDLYGKNKANISGMIYLFNVALEVSKNVDQRN